MDWAKEWYLLTLVPTTLIGNRNISTTNICYLFIDGQFTDMSLYINKQVTVAVEHLLSMKLYVEHYVQAYYYDIIIFIRVEENNLHLLNYRNSFNHRCRFDLN